MRTFHTTAIGLTIAVFGLVYWNGALAEEKARNGPEHTRFPI